jgi:hypothetical protein
VNVEIPEDKNKSPVITGKVDINSIDKLVIGKAMMDAWTVNQGRIDAKTISVALLEDGGVKASVGDLDLTNFSVRGPDGWIRFSLADMGGKFSYDAKGTLDIEDIHFGSLKVFGIHWKVGETGFIESKKTSTLSDLKLKGHVDTRLEPVKAKPGKTVKEGETERKISRVVIDKMHVGKIESEELTYQMKTTRSFCAKPIRARKSKWSDSSRCLFRT